MSKFNFDDDDELYECRPIDETKNKKIKHVYIGTRGIEIETEDHPIHRYPMDERMDITHLPSYILLGLLFKGLKWATKNN